MNLIRKSVILNASNLRIGEALNHKKLRIHYKDGKDEVLILKSHFTITPMDLHRMARAGTTAIIFHMYGAKLLKGEAIASIDFIVEDEPWDYDDPTN